MTCGCYVQFSREDVCPVAFGATVVRFEDCEVRRGGYRIQFCPLHAQAEQLAATLQVMLDEINEVIFAASRVRTVEAARALLTEIGR